MTIAQVQNLHKQMLVLFLVMVGIMLTMTPASAAEYHGFVKNQWYIGKGGKAVEVKDFAADPRRYLRSEAAYQHLLHHVAEATGKKMDEESFKEFLQSDDVRLVRCVGRVKTAGITDGGQVGWKERNCYLGEYLIEVSVPGGRMIVASQGCYNPIVGKQPRLSPLSTRELNRRPLGPPVNLEAPGEPVTAKPTPVQEKRPTVILEGRPTLVVINPVYTSVGCCPSCGEGALPSVPGSVYLINPTQTRPFGKF